MSLWACMVGASGGLRPPTFYLFFHHQLHHSDFWLTFSCFNPIWRISIACYAMMINFHLGTLQLKTINMKSEQKSLHLVDTKWLPVHTM